MNYDESVKYIHSMKKFGIKPGLERISYLCEKLGEPQNDLKFVHVVGTNGKGSVSTMLSESFIAGGSRTGLFISPYVSSFNERIQIDSEPVNEEVFARAVSEIKEIISGIYDEDFIPTEFEVITAAALLIFKREGCDICVMEAGLGGRLDSTNIIPPPLVSVITSISLDHTEILGDTVEKIAAEKCGIIKTGSRVVCYLPQKDEVREVVEAFCEKKRCEAFFPETQCIENVTESPTGVSFSYKGKRFDLSMQGGFQVYNAVTAYEAALLAGVKEKDALKGVCSAVLPARLEVLSKEPLVILDGWHNPGAGEDLRKFLLPISKRMDVLCVIGMMADKNTREYLSYVAPLCSEMITTQVRDNPRSLGAQELKKQAEEYCPNVTAFPDAEEAVKEALKRNRGCLMICGSLYLAGQARKLFKTP